MIWRRIVGLRVWNISGSGVQVFGPVGPGRVVGLS